MAFARLERDAWTDPAVADAYDRLWAAFVAPSIPRLLDAALVGPGDRILDVATGPGPVSRGALARGADPVALDFSLPMLRKGDPHVPRIRADAARLPLHVPDPEGALREAARAVRPGGVVAFAVWGPAATALTIVPSSIQALGIAPPSHAAPGFFRFGEPGAFEVAMRNAGLLPLPTEHIEWAGTIPEPEVFWGMFHDGSARTRASILALGTDDRERLHAEVLRRVREFRVGTAFEVPTSVVVGRGRRP
jgi:SAM-dependent methyltransferase